MIARLKTECKRLQTQLKQHFDLYQNLYNDPRTPRLAKIFLWAAIGYTLLPFDLIPDFIPILGHLDDVIIIPSLIYLAHKSIPPELLDEHRKRVLPPTS